MNFQPYQLVFLFIFIILGFGILKTKSKNIRIFLIALAVVIFLFNPFRFKQEGGAVLERSSKVFEEIPEKVVVKEKNFDESQNKEMELLKKQTEGLKDEIHD